MKVLSVDNRGETCIVNNVTHIQLEPNGNEIYAKLYLEDGGWIKKVQRIEIVDDGKDIF